MDVSPPPALRLRSRTDAESLLQKSWRRKECICRSGFFGSSVCRKRGLSRIKVSSLSCPRVVTVVAAKGRKGEESSPFSVLKQSGVQWPKDSKAASNGAAVGSPKKKGSAGGQGTSAKPASVSNGGARSGGESSKPAGSAGVHNNGSAHCQAKEIEPPRIMSKLNATLRILKHYKELESKSTPVQATSYRKKKPDKTKANDLANMLPLDSYISGDRDVGFEAGQGEPVLLVDGYNICGYWPRLKRYFAKGDLDTARMRLLIDLAMYGSLRGMKVVAAFDALHTGRLTSKEEFQGVEVVFTASEADAWIEKEVGVLKAKGCPRVWVATSDRSEGDYCWGKGAIVWSAGYLVSEIKSAKKELEEDLEKLQKDKYSFKGKLLEHRLDESTVTDLQRLRLELANENRG